MSKRQAGNQITKDREEEEEDWGRDGPPDPVEEASAQVLATRKIALPKSRKRNQDSDPDREQTTSNPFSFGIPASTASAETVTKANPFASLSNNTPFVSTAATPATSTPTFSFGTSVAQTQSKNNTTSETVNSSSPAATSASNDDQYDALLRQRSINACFKQAVSACLENDAFADLTKICDEYREHWNSVASVPVEPTKNTTGTNIYPSLKATSTDTTSKQESSKEADPQKAPSFAFNASTPSFSFGASTTSSTGATFSFGQTNANEKKSEAESSAATTEMQAKPKSSEASDSSSQTPTFTFGQKSTTESVPTKSATTFNFGQSTSTSTTEAPDQSSKAESQTTETPKKISEPLKSNDFSWTPDRGIKFGDSSKTSETKASAPVFGFQNPLASPSQSTKDQNVSPKPPTTGFSFGSSGNTGFSFGQAMAKPTEEKSDAGTDSASSKTPAFSFGSSAPPFSFGQSTTPSFSFSAPAKTPATEADKPVATLTTDAAAATEGDGDAMPEEPRTNDALVAGPGVGEEDEDEVYTVPRAKLFKFNSGNTTSPWTDLGICVVRVLVHRETQKARMVARAEGAGALRLNARMYPHFKYTLEGKSNAKVYDLVSASKTDTYLIKMKEKETATTLVKTLNEKKG